MYYLFHERDGEHHDGFPALHATSAKMLIPVSESDKSSRSRRGTNIARVLVLAVDLPLRPSLFRVGS